MSKRSLSSLLQLKCWDPDLLALHATNCQPPGAEATALSHIACCMHAPDTAKATGQRDSPIH